MIDTLTRYRKGEKMKNWKYITLFLLVLASPAIYSYHHYVIYGCERSIRVESVAFPEKYVEIDVKELDMYPFIKRAIETDGAIKIPRDDTTTDKFIKLLVKGNTSVFRIGGKFYRLIIIYD